MPLLPDKPAFNKPNRRAAQSSTVPDNTFSALANADARMINLHAQRKAGHFSIASQKLCQEMIQLHAGRQFPRLSAAMILSDTQKTLLESRQETAAIHSRITHIKLVAHVKKRRLDEHIKRMKYYLTEKYGASLRASTTTKTAQESLVNSVLREFYSLSFELETVLQTVDILIQDLDKSSFAINVDLELVKLSTRPERSI